MNDPIDRLMEERQKLEAGFPKGLALSVGTHILVFGLAIGIPLLRQAEPLLRVQDGFAVAMPPGGRGVETAELPREGTPQQTPPVATPAAPQAEAPLKVLKPPKEEPRKGLAMPDAKASKKPAETKGTTGPPRPALGRQQAGAPGGVGTGQATPGLAFAPDGAGVPGGTDIFGDWYMAGVQRKIWTLWTQQLKGAMSQPATVAFTILQDGTVTDVKVVQSSGAFLLDQAAQRAISSAGPFGPLPKNYETNRITVQALFKPTS